MNTLIFGIGGYVISLIYCFLAGHEFGKEPGYLRGPKSGSVITFVFTSVAGLIGLGIDIGKYLG